MLCVHITWCPKDTNHHISDQSEIISKITDYVKSHYPVKDSNIVTGSFCYDIIMPRENHNDAKLTALAIAINAGLDNTHLNDLFINLWTVYDHIKFEIINKELRYVDIEIEIYFKTKIDLKLLDDICSVSVYTDKTTIGINGYFEEKDIKQCIEAKLDSLLLTVIVPDIDIYKARINELMENYFAYGATTDTLTLINKSEVTKSAVEYITINYLD